MRHSLGVAFGKNDIEPSVGTDLVAKFNKQLQPKATTIDLSPLVKCPEELIFFTCLLLSLPDYIVMFNRLENPKKWRILDGKGLTNYLGDLM